MHNVRGAFRDDGRQRERERETETERERQRERDRGIVKRGKLKGRNREQGIEEGEAEGRIPRSPYEALIRVILR